MLMKPGFDLLKGETIDVSAKPHPLSFLKYYLTDMYLVLIAVILNQAYGYIKSDQKIMEILNLLFNFVPGVKPEDLLLFIMFWAILVLSGLLIGVFWVSKMPLFYMVLLGLAGTLLELYFLTPYKINFIPKPLIKVWLLVPAALIGLFLIEAYRKGHRYFVTNYRIVMIKKFIGKEMREIMYDKITDIHINQGVLGRIFNYGTITPISASSFGLGEDAALASVSAAAQDRKRFLGISFGGKRGVNRPRAATYFSLYGIPKPREIHAIIANRQLETKEAPILKRIEDILKEEKEEKNGQN